MITMKSNEYFQAFYLDGKPFYGRRPDDDITDLLMALAKQFDFDFKYIGDLSQKEMENFHVVPTN